MPAFKFNYLDQTLTLGTLRVGSSVALRFVTEEPPVEVELKLQLPVSLSIEAAVTSPITLPLLSFFAEAIVTGDSFHVSIPVALRFTAEVPLFTFATIKIKDISPELRFDVFNPVFANMNIVGSNLLQKIHIYHPVFADIDIGLRLPYLKFTANHIGLNFLKIEIPTPSVSLKGFSVLTYCSFGIKTPTVLCKFSAEEYNIVDEPTEIIKFEYEQWMYKLLKSERPDYSEADIINFLEGGEL